MGARVLGHSAPGAYCRCPNLGRPEMGAAKHLGTQLMSPAVPIPSAEMLVQVPLGPGHCILIPLLHLTQIDDYFLILLFLVSPWVRNKAVFCSASAITFLRIFCMVQLTPAIAVANAANGSRFSTGRAAFLPFYISHCDPSLSSMMELWFAWQGDFELKHNQHHFAAVYLSDSFKWSWPSSINRLEYQGVIHFW